MPPANLWLSRYAKLVVISTLILIYIGGMVTSMDAGMSVPDWPTSYGHNMFAFPFQAWVGPKFWEHTHRVVASTLGVLTVVLTVWVWLEYRTRWLRVLAVSAFVVVVIQGILGGLRVTDGGVNPVLDSLAMRVAHGCLAQVFLCQLAWIALAVSPLWPKPLVDPVEPARLRSVKRWMWGVTLLIFIQLILGALMRHKGAGLAIPTFPLMPDGSFFPKVPSFEIHLHFAHRLWAVVIVVATVIASMKVLGLFREERRMTRPTLWLLGLMFLQVALGISVILLSRPPVPTSFHVINGAILLMTSFCLAVRASDFCASLPVDGEQPHLARS